MTSKGLLQVEARPAHAPRKRLFRWETMTAAALVLLVLVGLAWRVRGVAAVGLTEDEINKLEAIERYGQGDFTPNAEHPMLMKMLMWGSLKTANVINNLSSDNDLRRGIVKAAQFAGAAEGNNISLEAALRAPNLLFGALTVIPLFLLTAAFFDRWTGLTAATLWAVGVNAITHNRVGKEDTLLVFFLLFAFYFFVRAKQISGFDLKAKNRAYALSGAAFGLMLASKYFPHYFGLNMLYHHWYRVRERLPSEPRGRAPKHFYLIFLAVFLLVNPAILWPGTWEYMRLYAGEKLLTHTGYLMGATLYKNNMSGTPFAATPNYFYLLFLAIKVPLAVTGAMLAGLWVAVRQRKHPGHAFLLLMFVLWIVPYSLAGAKWLRYTLSLMPLVYMLAAVGMVAIVRGLAHKLRAKTASAAVPFVLAGVAWVIFIAWPAWGAWRAGPHYALYVNELGAGRAGYFFPHDEFYDDGLREAIKYVCDNAPPNAVIVSETPGVVRTYLKRFGRTDLQSKVLSDPKFNLADAPAESYFILQNGRTYFENRDKMQAIRAGYRNPFTMQINGLNAAEVYVLDRQTN